MPWKISARNWNAAVVLAMTFLPLSILQAQDAQQDTRPPVVSVDRIPQDSRDANPQPASPPAAAHPLGQPADGRRRGDLPLDDKVNVWPYRKDPLTSASGLNEGPCRG